MQRIRGVSGPIVGHYRIAALSGLTTLMGANAPVFSARFATALYLRAAILRLRATALIITPFTSAQEIILQAQLASGFTVSDTGGTPSIPVAAQNSLLQVSEVAQVSAFTDIRVAAAAALAAGTRVLDTIPFVAALGCQALAAASAAVMPIVADYDVSSDQRLPVILQGITPTIGQQAIAGVQPPAPPANIAANAQGIVISSAIAQGLAGTVRFLIEMEWVEFATNSSEVIN